MATKITPGEVVALSPGKLYALGATVSQDNDIHWIAKDRKGDAPLNVYLLLEGSHGLLIDTGYPIIEHALKDQLATLPIDDLKIVFTRAVEMESVGNADVIVERWPVKEIWSHFTAYDWVYFRTNGKFPSPPPFESYTFGTDGSVNVTDERPLETIGAKLKLLNAAWVYDPVTKTLFTSDSFSHVLAPNSGERVITEESDTTSVDDVYNHLKAKFRWIEGADTEPLQEFITDTFNKYDVENIAPSFGCIISGRRLVVKHRDLMNKALKKLDGKAD